MALTTRCPQCGTSFKVVPDQLRVRNGLVRCGACSTVFDGRACLLPEPGSPIVPSAPVDAPLPSAAAAAAAPVLATPVAPVAPSAPPAPVAPSVPPAPVAPSDPPAPAARAAAPPFEPVPPPVPSRPSAVPPAVPQRTAEPRMIAPWEDEPAPWEPASGPAPVPARQPAATPPAVLRSREDILRRSEPAADFPQDDRADAEDGEDSDDTFRREPAPWSTAPAPGPSAYRDEPMVARRRDEPVVGWRAARGAGAHQAEPSFADTGTRRRHDPEPDRRHDPEPDRRYDPELDRRHDPEPDRLHDPEPDRRHDDVRDAERDDEYDGEDELDDDSLREPVLGEARTRYSSATDVGRAPPEFLDQDREERRGLWRKLWAYACLTGLIVLGLQLLYAYRTDIANSVPVLRPVLETVCRPLGCTVGYARRLERIAISSSSLQPPTGAAAIDDGRSRLVLTLVMHNRYDKPQHWPALVLDLTDLSDTVVVRKVLMPQNYLTPEQLRGPFGPAGELKISVPIEVTGVQVNGYQLDKFFP